MSICTVSLSDFGLKGVKTVEKGHKEKKLKFKFKKSLFTIFTVAAICVFASFMVLNQININSRQQKLAELEQSIKLQRLENEKASNEIKNSDDAEYIERIAREKYGYVRSGDRVYVNTK